MSSLMLSLISNPPSTAFDSPETIEIDEVKAHEVINSVHHVMVHTALPIEEITFNPSIIDVKTDLMGWDLSSWSIGKDNISLSLTDINGIIILYQAEIPLD